MKPRDLALLDAIDACRRTSFSGTVWRVAREGKDPLQPSGAHGRWSNGTFDALYTALERDGAVAEIFALISAQPVFPSRMRWWAHRLHVSAKAALKIADATGLRALGIDTATYRERSYSTSQSIADAAFFLGFDGLIAPSARWDCLNLMLFAGRIAPADIVLEDIEPSPIDWTAWQAARRR